MNIMTWNTVWMITGLLGASSLSGAAVDLGQLMPESALLSDSGVVHARDFTCEDLQRMVIQAGALEVRSGFNTHIYVAQMKDCQSSEPNAGTGAVVSKDKWVCKIGFVCTGYGLPSVGGGG